MKRMTKQRTENGQWKLNYETKLKVKRPTKKRETDTNQKIQSFIRQIFLLYIKRHTKKRILLAHKK